MPSNCHIEDKIKEDKKREKIATPEGVSESTFKDFLKLRKAKRLPWTETVEKSFTKEAEKLKWTMQQVIEYCCKKGWAGFEASWVKDELTANNQSNDKSWMFSNEGIVAKANELGVRSEGLSYQQLKDKCVFVMAQRSMQ